MSGRPLTSAPQLQGRVFVYILANWRATSPSTPTPPAAAVMETMARSLSTRKINSEAPGDGKYLLSSRGAVWRAYSEHGHSTQLSATTHTIPALLRAPRLGGEGYCSLIVGIWPSLRGCSPSVNPNDL